MNLEAKQSEMRARMGKVQVKFFRYTPKRVTRMECTWNRCTSQGKPYLVKTTDPSLLSAHGETIPLASTGVDRVYCRFHKEQALVHGFELAERATIQ